MGSKEQYEIDHLADGTERTIDLSMIPLKNLANVTLTNTSGGCSTPGFGATPAVYTVGTSSTFANPWATKTTLKGSQLELEGSDADVVIDGKSLTKTLEALEQRLNILVPNPELEKEWTELRELGDRYRELEQQIQAKQATWDCLRAMPPPVIE